jgi:hypothetical protein
MKNFVKALDRNGLAFSFMCNSQSLVRRISRPLCSLSHRFRYPEFDLALGDNDKEAWNALQHGATGFLGNVQPSTSESLLRIEQLLTRSLAATCHSTHFLHSHMNSFRVKCDAVRDEHGRPSHKAQGPREKAPRLIEVTEEDWNKRSYWRKKII